MSFGCHCRPWGGLLENKFTWHFFIQGHYVCSKKGKDHILFPEPGVWITKVRDSHYTSSVAGFNTVNTKYKSVQPQPESYSNSGTYSKSYISNGTNSQFNWNSTVKFRATIQPGFHGQPPNGHEKYQGGVAGRLGGVCLEPPINLILFKNAGKVERRI